jgi:predicted Zn-dependent peptidase
VAVIRFGLTLTSGLRVTAIRDRTAEAVFLRVLLPGGETDEPVGLGGLCDMAAELSKKGAGGRTACGL